MRGDFPHQSGNATEGSSPEVTVTSATPRFSEGRDRLSCLMVSLFITNDGVFGVRSLCQTHLSYFPSQSHACVYGPSIPCANRFQGKGTTFVVYNDARLRIFRSDTGGVVVQTKANEVVPV